MPICDNNSGLKVEGEFEIKFYPFLASIFCKPNTRIVRRKRQSCINIVLKAKC